MEKYIFTKTRFSPLSSNQLNQLISFLGITHHFSDFRPPDSTSNAGPSVPSPMQHYLIRSACTRTACTRTRCPATAQCRVRVRASRARLSRHTDPLRYRAKQRAEKHAAWRRVGGGVGAGMGRVGVLGFRGTKYPCKKAIQPKTCGSIQLGAARCWVVGLTD